MPPEPTTKRTVVFIDGQNLFHAAREAFGYTHPNYDVPALAAAICTRQGWQLDQVRFYTGIPGINKTDWITIDRATYDSCLDPRDYRPTKPAP
jgi:hypothetical protein